MDPSRREEHESRVVFAETHMLEVLIKKCVRFLVMAAEGAGDGFWADWIIGELFTLGSNAFRVLHCPTTFVETAVILLLGWPVKDPWTNIRSRHFEAPFLQCR